MANFKKKKKVNDQSPNLSLPRLLSLFNKEDIINFHIKTTM